MEEISTYYNNQIFCKIAEGDEQAFRIVFDHFKQSFFAAAYKMTRSADTAEEIIQEVFISLWNNRKKVAAAKNPEGYLMKMLHNSIYAHFRQVLVENRLKKKLSEQQGEAVENSIEELLLAKENRNILNTIIGKLPPQQQLVYQLSKQEGLSRDEIAHKLQISPNTVRNHLSAATEFLTTHF